MAGAAAENVWRARLSCKLRVNSVKTLTAQNALHTLYGIKTAAAAQQRCDVSDAAQGVGRLAEAQRAGRRRPGAARLVRIVPRSCQVGSRP